MKEKIKEINYEINYHKGLKEYILWKQVHINNGYNNIAIYKGSRKDCNDKLKELKILVNK